MQLPFVLLAFYIIWRIWRTHQKLRLIYILYWEFFYFWKRCLVEHIFSLMHPWWAFCRAVPDCFWGESLSLSTWKSIFQDWHCPRDLHIYYLFVHELLPLPYDRFSSSRLFFFCGVFGIILIYIIAIKLDVSSI